MGSAQAVDAPACVGTSDLRTGSTLAPGVPTRDSDHSRPPLPGPQQCSHSLGRPRGRGREELDRLSPPLSQGCFCDPGPGMQGRTACLGHGAENTPASLTLPVRDFRSHKQAAR